MLGKNDRARAEADFARVRDIDRANVVVLHGEGVLAMNAGNLESAVESFTAALGRNPSDAWSIQMRADAYQQMGEFQKARQDREKLRQLSQSAKDNLRPSPNKIACAQASIASSSTAAALFWMNSNLSAGSRPISRSTMSRAAWRSS